MVHEYSYTFDQLTIDHHYLSSMLGFPDGDLPEPFNEYVFEAFNQAPALCNIRGAFCFSCKSSFVPGYKSIIVDGHEFEIGKTVAKELRNSTSMTFFICTAGEGISRRSSDLLKGENPVLGYVYDVLGSMIVEAATDLLQQEIEQKAAKNGLAITNRYSPGYCKWSVADQHKLFSFFPAGCCGIHLTDSALMSPVKSVSGIIGMGEEVVYRDYTCDLCNMTDCFHRNHHRNFISK
ncbi:MAG: vitamin B12 dependent-methionine synthase activation domain-containing protein [Candidatus Saccharibacteria bacterium]